VSSSVTSGGAEASARASVNRAASSTRSPAATVTRPRAPPTSASRPNGARRVRRTGPPQAATPPSTGAVCGTVSPYSMRGAKTVSNSTVPCTPSIRRSSTCGLTRPMSWARAPGSSASASTTSTFPASVVNVVRSTSVPSS